jgi:hypothetical protein
MAQPEWFEADESFMEEYPVTEYDLTAVPNDFNVITLVNLIDSGVVKIPTFQRHYVWDLPRASKLIESLIIGLPVPQIFFYEEKKNLYLVIDGQQRLMTIYYFVKGRFPRPDKRTDLRDVFARHGKIPIEIMDDDTYFYKFNLYLEPQIEDQINKFNKKNYNTLEEYQSVLNLRTMRCVVVKSRSDSEDDSAVYEIFNRLNTGGMNLASQEIRVSLYDSDFMKMLIKLNNDPNWRRLIGIQPDIHMRDVEMLLRAGSILVMRDKYSKPMTRFVNNFSKKAKKMKPEMVSLLSETLATFFQKCISLKENIFKTSTGKFSAVLFETVFFICTRESINQNKVIIIQPDEKKIEALKIDPDFIEASTVNSTNVVKFNKRIEIAEKHLLG